MQKVKKGGVSFLFPSLSFVPKKHGRKSPSPGMKGKTARLHLSCLVNNRQPIVCVDAYLITVYTQLNDLNVACNHLSWQQLISFRVRNGGRPLKVSCCNVCEKNNAYTVWQLWYNAKKTIIIKITITILIKDMLKREDDERMRFLKRMGTRAKPRLNHN